MSVYTWCVSCQEREDKCTNPNSHKAARSLQYRSDFLLGGRYGVRVRKLFSLKRDAESYEYVTMADYKRGQFIPDQNEKSKTAFSVFIKAYQDECVNRYMDGKREECYRLGIMVRVLKDKPLKHINLADGDYLIQFYLNEGLEKTTINRNITSLKAAFKWAVEHGYLRVSPFEKLKKFKVDGKRTRWLNDYEITEMLRACEILRDFDMKDILLVALNTGFRKDNLETITAKDVLPNDRLQALKTKQKDTYDVPIGQSLAVVLKKLMLLRPSGALLNFTNFRRRFDAVLKTAKLKRGAKDAEKVTLHTFRHTFISQGLKRGVPIHTMSKWADHYSMDFTLKHYGHLCPNQEQVEMALLNLGNAIDSSFIVDTLLTLNQPKLDPPSENS